MPMQSTYLAWVNFEETGWSSQKMIETVQTKAGIVANHGAAFGAGGEMYLRFNFACPRVRIEEALERLHHVFK